MKRELINDGRIQAVAPKALAKRLRVFAVVNDIGFADVVRQAVTEFLDRHDAKSQEQK